MLVGNLHTFSPGETIDAETGGVRDQEDILSGAVSIRPGQSKIYRVVSAHESDPNPRIELHFIEGSLFG